METSEKREKIFEEFDKFFYNELKELNITEEEFHKLSSKELIKLIKIRKENTI